MSRLYGELSVCVELAERLDVKEQKSTGLIQFTNYRLVYQDSKNSSLNFDVPLKSISKLVHEKDIIYVHCKDCRVLMLRIAGERLEKLFFEKLRQYAFPTKLEHVFAFRHYGVDYPWRVNMEEELRRCCRLDTQPSLKLYDNREFKLSPTYPPVFVVHLGISDSDLATVAAFRSRGRVPAVVWTHPTTNALLVRCSQPNRGLLFRRSPEDEALIGWYRQNANSKESIAIADARSPMAAWGNQLKGKGAETANDYEGEMKNMDIENIHVVRSAMEALMNLTASNSSTYNDDNYLAQLAATGWLANLKRLLEGSLWISHKLEVEQTTILVHCSDGWDRTAQLTSLSQLLLDPFYRTMQGFAVLVEKEWVQFGHKFAERTGHSFTRDVETERSPIFIQFLDAVWQLTTQFPQSFEFNEKFLLALTDHVSSCRFGTFLCDTAKERAAFEVAERTPSVWGYLLRYRSRFENHSYTSYPGRLVPSCKSKNLHLWEGFFFRRDVTCASKFTDDFEALSVVPINSSLSFALPPSSSSDPSTMPTAESASSGVILGSLKQVWQTPMYYLGKMFPEKKQDTTEPAAPPVKFFGVSLETGLAQSGGSPVPLPVVQMIQYLEANGGVQREGLFRVGGKKMERQELMESWKRGEQSLPSDVDGAADLLKHYFLELPESLIPESHYLGFVNVGKSLASKDDKKRAYQNLVISLPPPVVNVLSYLIGFLAKVSSQAEVNKMTAHNLAVCWAPNLLRSSSVSAQEQLLHVKFTVEAVETLIECSSDILPPPPPPAVISSASAPSSSSSSSSSPSSSLQPPTSPTASQVRISVIGEAGVGKQSFINCFSNLSQGNTVTLGDSQVMIEWSQTMDSAALKQADVIIVCFKFSYYPSFFRILASGQEIRGLKKPTMLVGLQSDLESNKSIEFEIRECVLQMAASSYRLCSALSGDGVAAAVHEAVRLAMQNTKKGSAPVAVKLARIFPSEQNSGVEITPPGSEAAQLENVSFSLKDTPKKWLFHAEDYLRPQSDPGPSRALHGALAGLKNLALMQQPLWQQVLETVPIQVGLLKATSDCGNTSVSMGLAARFFQRNGTNSVALLNFGTGGVRFQLYTRNAEGIVSCLLEYKPPGHNKGVLSKLSFGKYQPEEKGDPEEVKAEIEEGLRLAPWNNTQLAQKFNLGVVPVFAFVTGTLRNFWENNPDDAVGISDAVNQFLERVLGQSSYFSQILQEADTQRFEFLMPQRLEGQMELVACRAMYEQYSAMTGKKLEPIISLGCGKASSQWTSLDPDVSLAQNFTKYTLEPVMQFGMDSPDLAEKLGSAIVQSYEREGQLEGLARLALAVYERGNVPVIALKSGCLVGLDDYASGGKQRRKALVEFNVEVGPPVSVHIRRRDSASEKQCELPMCLPVACALASTLLPNEKGETSDFLKVQVDDHFMAHLSEVKPGATLVFWTASDLRSLRHQKATEAASQEEGAPVVIHLEKPASPSFWALFGRRVAPSLNLPTPQPQEPHAVKVGIIGGGLSGLYAAIILKDLGLKAQVLEANPERLGGRFFTKHFNHSEPWAYAEMGASKFPCIKLMDRLIGNETWSLVSYLNRHSKGGEGKQLRLVPYVTSHPNNLKCFNGVVKKADDPCWNDPFKLAQAVGGNLPAEFAEQSPDLSHCFSDITAALHTDADEGLKELQQLDNLSTRTFLEKRFPPSVVDWMEVQDASVSSYDQAVIEHILRLDLEEEKIEWVCIEGGSERLIDEMAKVIGPSSIRQNAKVTAIAPSSDGQVHVSVGGEKLDFNHVISTVPPTVLRLIDTSACRFSSAKRAALRSLGNDQHTRVALRFKTRFWERDECMGGRSCEGGESVTDLNVGTVLYPSYGIGDKREGVLLVNCWRQEPRLGLLSPEQRVELCLRELELVHGPVVREQYLAGGHFSHCWSQDPFAMGGSVSFAPSQFGLHFEGLISSAIENRLHFAGEAASVHHSWAVGALNSAYRAVAQILIAEGLTHHLTQLVAKWGVVAEVNLPVL